MHLVAHDVWEPWTRIGDRALTGIHKDWTEKMAAIWLAYSTEIKRLDTAIVRR
jgi:hypothetical protein